MPEPYRFVTAVLTGSDHVGRVASGVTAAVGAAVASLLRRPAPAPVRRTLRPGAAAELDRWTPARLKQTLRAHLHGERLVVLSNREPCLHEHAADGSIFVRHPVSGLVTALEPVVRACSGVWIAHGSGSADRDVVDRGDCIAVSSGDAAYRLRRVWLTADEERGYYYGFANEGLWPLCHVAHAAPIFRRGDWETYQRVNERFADAVVAEVDRDDPIVLVQDYHFALAPRLLRERLPRATILAFWHIPWPNAERFAMCPWHETILDGLLGASIVGFQTPQHCANFVECVERSLEARIDREDQTVVRRGLRTRVRAYPISIAWPDGDAPGAPPVEVCRASVRAEFGLEPNVSLVVSVDRLDYTKGIEERLASIERLLERVAPGAAVFLQVAAPTRGLIDRYRELAERVQSTVDRINQRFGADGRNPIVFVNRHVEPPDVARYYRAADVAYVSSLHDGMNLVAKEFVAARDDGRGVLVLSRFAGASRELTGAVVVNPYDIDGVADVLQSAIAMPEAAQRERMRAMRAAVERRNVYRWAGHMLLDAARLRDRVVA